MANWSPEAELSIRRLGDYVEKQMKDLLNPDASVTGSVIRIAFRAASTGIPALDDACMDAGVAQKGGWLGSLQQLCDLADANKSDAADKIKKALPIATQLTAEFKTDASASGIRGKVRLAKSKGIAY